MVFPVVMYGCESWTIKKAKHWKIDAFELWCWRRLLRVSWIARISNQSILKEISPEYSLEGLMLKVKLRYFGHWCEELTHWKRPWCRERLKAGGEGDDRGWDGWMPSPTQWTWAWASSGSWWWTRRPGVLQSMGSQRVRYDDWATELNWIEVAFVSQQKEKYSKYDVMNGVQNITYYLLSSLFTRMFRKYDDESFYFCPFMPVLFHLRLFFLKDTLTKRSHLSLDFQVTLYHPKKTEKCNMKFISLHPLFEIKLNVLQFYL